MEQYLGAEAMIRIIVHLFFFVLTFWALQSLRLDLFVKNVKQAKAQVLIILLTIAIGSLVANFLLDYFFWGQRLRYFL